MKQMKIDKIEEGIVLDHITAGKALDIYASLALDKEDCPVAIITNVKSSRLRKKDVLKIEKIIDIDLDVLGYLDQGITVNIIKQGEPVEKKTLQLPQQVTGIIKCKNPRCITSSERAIEQRFYLSEEAGYVYRCAYCEAKYEG